MVLFSYSTYLWYSCIVPLIGFFIGLFCLAFSILKTFKRNKAILHSKTSSSMIGVLLPWLITVVFLFFSIQPLSNGFCLLWEKESEAILTGGTVTEIQDVKYSPRYVYQGDSAVRASWVTVDSVEQPLYFMTAKDIEIGESLSVKYLPESRMVLGYGSDKDLESLGGATAEQPEKKMNVDLFGIVFFLFVLFIMFSQNRKKSRKFEKPSQTIREEWEENTICYRKETNKKNIMMGIGIVIVGIVLEMIFQNGASLLSIFGFVMILSTLNIGKRPVLEYDEDGIYIYRFFGKAQHIPFSKISIEKFDSIVALSFPTVWLNQTGVRTCNLNYHNHIGIDRFLSFYNEHTGTENTDND